MTKIFLTHRDNQARITGRATKLVNGVVTVIDLSTETSANEIIFKKPDGSTETVTASITNSPGTDGLFHYDATGTFFLDNPYWWNAQAKFTFTDGKIQHSNPVKPFYIAPTLLD